MSLSVVMEWYEFLGVCILVIAIGYVAIRRALNVTIASWVGQLPQLISQVSGSVQLPKVKLMDALGYGAMQIMSDPNVKQAISQTITKALQGIGGQKQLPPGGPPVG